MCQPGLLSWDSRAPGVEAEVQECSLQTSAHILSINIPLAKRSHSAKLRIQARRHRLESTTGAGGLGLAGRRQTQVVLTEPSEVLTHRSWEEAAHVSTAWLIWGFELPCFERVCPLQQEMRPASKEEQRRERIGPVV